MRALRAILLFCMAFASAVAQAHGGGESGGGSMPSVSGPQRPEDAAKSHYNDGVRSIKKAKDSEADAAKAASPEKSAKALDKAKGYYQKAAGQFIDAISADPKMYQAWNYLGFAKRHLGDYQDSLSAYAKALELNPDYPDAIEYRGEAYLGLNQIESAKEAYMKLFRDSRSLADELMLAMHHWVDARRQDAQGVSSADLEAFSQWMDERTQLAAKTASLAPGSRLTRWP